MTFDDFKRRYEKEEVKEYKNILFAKPTVSVCVQTYQHVNYIKDCLDGILMQKTSFRFEILLGDDESTDGTREICREYAEKYPEKIRFFLHSRENNIQVNGNPTGRFNFLYNLYSSNGKYIAICEGDDYWTDPLKLQKQVDFLEKFPGYSLCFTRFRIKFEETNTFQDDRNGHYFSSASEHIDFSFEVFENWSVGMQTLVLRKSSFNQEVIGKYKFFKDVHLFTELLLKGRGACLNFFGAVYRLHESGIHSSLNKINMAKIGSQSYCELYYHNKDVLSLRKKYYHFHQSYISLLVRNSNYKRALINMALLGLKEGNTGFILRNLKIVQKDFTKKMKKKFLRVAE